MSGDDPESAPFERFVSGDDPESVQRLLEDEGCDRLYVYETRYFPTVGFFKLVMTLSAMMGIYQPMKTLIARMLKGIMKLVYRSLERVSPRIIRDDWFVRGILT